ncbi:hypothetical protein [Actinacidiphila sp. bgisy167]|uniref:hypothetical protein n=1 Tax=Actinacidiphila sp. bgisy167 TaxID=3413797 RepID=UPI003D72C016
MTAEYKAAHARVRAEYGPAHLYCCLWCGGKADEWAHAYSDQDALTDSAGLVYSNDPKHYGPLCSRDHRAFDGMKRRGADVYEFMWRYFRATARLSKAEKRAMAADRRAYRKLYATAAPKVPRALRAERDFQRANVRAVERDDQLTPAERDAQLVAQMECAGWTRARIERATRNTASKERARRMMRATADAV